MADTARRILACYNSSSWLGLAWPSQAEPSLAVSHTFSQNSENGLDVVDPFTTLKH